MNNSLQRAAICMAALSWFPLIVNAALFDRGGGLVYDSVLDITWLRNANPLFEAPTEVCPPELGGEVCFPEGGKTGAVTFEAAVEFVENLAYYDAIRDETYNDWRLPTVSPINGTDYQTNFTNNATSDEGYARTTTDGSDGGWRDGNGDPVSELGHMFYVNLENKGSCTPNDASSASCNAQPGSETDNYGIFENLEKDPSVHFNNSYWTGTQIGDGKAGYQNFRSGFKGRGDTEASGNPDYLYVWAVRDGDVSPVPVPAALYLFAPGVLGLLGLARRRIF